MTKALKFVFTILSIIILFININFSYATSEEGNTSENTSNTASSSSNTVTENTSSSLSTLSPSSVTSVSNINSYEQANLQLNNILSIILIAIGVLLILFAIAILIKLKGN